MNNNLQANNDFQNDICIPPGIRFIRCVYWIITISCFYILARKAVGAESMMKFSGAERALTSLIGITVLFGIYKRKTWTVPLVLFFSCWNLAISFLHVIGKKAVDIGMLERKFIHLSSALFCIYQILVFTRKETKAYFREKGQTVI